MTLLRNRAADAVEEDLAMAFGAEDAVTTVSGSAAILGAVGELTEPGQEVLVPGWVSATVVNAIVVAHRIPVLLDVTPGFTTSLAHAGEVVSERTGLVCYIPYGGHAPDFDEWAAWAERRRIPLLLDLVACADVRVWRQASRAAAAVTSFGPTKLLGPGGGGALLGPSRLVAGVRRFLCGGRDASGRKSGIGLDLRLGAAEAGWAQERLAAVLAGQDELRASTAVTLASIPPDRGLPGWDREPYALTKVLSLAAHGQDLNPDATYRSAGWRLELARRGLTDGSPPRLPALDLLYDRVRSHRITL